MFQLKESFSQLKEKLFILVNRIYMKNNLYLKTFMFTLNPVR